MFPFKSIARYPKFRSTCSKKSPKPEFLRRQAALKKRLELFVVPICGNHYVSVVPVNVRLHVIPK